MVKFILLTVFTFLLIIPFIGNTQTNTISFTEGIVANPTSKLEYGENILVKGELKSGNINGVTIHYYFGVNKRTVKANVSGNSWTAILDPLPIRTNLIIEVQIERTISSSDIEKLKALIESQIELKVDSLVKVLENGNLDINRYVNSNDLGSSIVKNLSSSFSEYYLDNGTTFSEYLLGLIDQEVSDELLVRLINSKKSIQEITSDPGLKAAVDTLLEKLDTIANKPLIESLGKFFKVDEIEELDIDEIKSKVNLLPDSVNKSVLLAVINSSTDYDQIEVLKKATSNLLSSLDTIEIKLKEKTFATSMETTAETLGAENYLGVDLGIVLVDQTGTAGLFVLINPYWGKKIDPEKDPSNLREKITPSFGFGFGGNDLEGKKPVYFVGVGLRINRIVRASFGTAINKNQGAKYFEWNLAAGISINVNFVGDLLKLTSAAQSSSKTN